MYKYSKSSLAKLEQAHPLLKLLFVRAIEFYDIKILETVRDEETQNGYYAQGVSQVKYPHGKHNKNPSLAVDFAVYNKGVSFNKDDMLLVAGFIEGLARSMGINVKLGARWNEPWVSLNKFQDIGHIELTLD
jgi:hypothetical protein